MPPSPTPGTDIQIEAFRSTAIGGRSGYWLLCLPSLRGVLLRLTDFDV